MEVLTVVNLWLTTGTSGGVDCSEQLVPIKHREFHT